jgi:hypothetical protein
MKFKKHGMKHENAESKKKETSEDANPAYKKAEARMKMMEKAMHGKNIGKNFKGYGNSKGMM